MARGNRVAGEAGLPAAFSTVEKQIDAFAYYARDFGAAGDNTTDDTAALNSLFLAAANDNRVAVLVGTVGVVFKTSGVVYGTGSSTNNKPCRILGSPKTIIRTTSTTAHVLHIGAGDNIAIGQLVNGWVKDLRLQGPYGEGASPKNHQAGLYLNGITQFAVENVTTTGTDIGFDLFNNCYGARFVNCRAGFFGANNVGVNLRHGDESGNQIFFHDCWFSGKVAAYHISGGCDGVVIIGGQISAGIGQTATQDTMGAVTWGKDYESGVIGGVGAVSLLNVDFEGSVHVWFFRGFSSVYMTVQNCPLLGNGSAPGAIGIIKTTNSMDSNFSFINNNVTGTWSGAVSMAVEGDYGTCYFNEQGWHGNGTFATVYSGDFLSMQRHSNVWRGTALYRTVDGRSQLALDGLRLRNNVGTLEKSTDGSTWSAV